MYSEFGCKPQTWDQSQKGTVTFDDDYNKVEVIVKFITGQIKRHDFIKLALSEYIIVSLSLSLVIAKFFPAVHNQIVSRATRLEHQSLYWGTAVVSNIFVYGLLFAAARGAAIYFQALGLEILYHLPYSDKKLIKLTIVPSVVEVIVNVILFVGALIASLRTKSSTEISFPRGIGKILLNISFFWSCACCCNCSQRCKVKLLRILIMFSIMTFVHRSIMDAISFVFLLFIEQTRALVVTVALLYTSSVVFLSSKIGYFTGGVCMLISVFGAVALMVVMYMIIVFSLNLKGVAGIVTGLIPSIALSAASWYIKKRLEKKVGQSNIATSMLPQYGTTGEAMNDGEREETEDNTDDRQMLLP